MKISLRLLLSLIVCIGGLSSCKKQYNSELYNPPTGQQGHIYEQMAANPSLSTFVSAIDRVPGLKATLNSSGLFTVMAPNNDAFEKYFASQQYKSIATMPVSLLTQIINFHIIKYMLFQVNFLNPGITKMNYGQFEYGTQDIAVFNDKLSNGTGRSIYYPGKQMQVYTPYYFSLGVTAADYKTVYGPDAHISADNQLNAMGAAVITKDIASGNGVIHIIDGVLVPPNNVAQELDSNPEYANYNALLKKRFLTYAYNQAATKAQGNNGDINGDGVVDSLWTRTYSINPYLDNEIPLAADKTTAINITAFIPTKAAFENYLNTKFLPFFSNNMDNVPTTTIQLLYNSEFTNTMDWPSKIDRGQEISVGGDNIAVSRGDIVSVKMASNGLFYQVNKVIEPAAFTTVTGPAFFTPNYSYLAQILTQTGLLPQLSNNSLKYTVLGAPNAAFTTAGINFVSGTNPTFTITTNGVTSNMSSAQLKSLIGSNVLVGAFTAGNLTDGFYQTQSGSYVAIKGGKIEGAVRGSLATIITPDISKSNGYFQGVDKVTLDPQQSIYDLVAASGTPNPAPYSYQKFKELCTLVGIMSKDFVSITAADAGKKFTLFVPSNEAIIAAQNAGLLPKTGAQGTAVLDANGKARLFAYIKYFFIQQTVFTDGKLVGTFPTSKTDANGAALPLTVSYPGILTVTDNTGAHGQVNISNVNNYPQNVIAKDGVIQVIDNAFVSQY